MNILGIDFGTRKIGLAWVQSGIDVVLPFGLVEQGSGDDNVAKIVSIVEEESIDKIVIGLPLGQEGEENDNTKRIRSFAKDLSDKTDKPIAFVNEAYSTHEAANLGGDASVDERSAMIILQEFLSGAEVQ